MTTNPKVTTRLNTLIARIADQFSIDTLHKSPARFDLKKLLWFNEQYIKMLSLEEFIERTEKFWSVLKLDINNHTHKLSLILDKNRINQLDQVGIESSVIWNYIPCDITELKWKKSTQEESIQALRELTTLIEKSSLNLEIALETNPQNLEEIYETRLNYWETTIKNHLVENNLDYGAYLWPLRLALSGKAKSASSFEILAILDVGSVLERLKGYLD